MQGKHCQFLLFEPAGRNLSALAVEDEVVSAVPVLNHIEPFVNLSSQRFQAQVATEEDVLTAFPNSANA